jgi:hypothetical protein
MINASGNSRTAIKMMNGKEKMERNNASKTTPTTVNRILKGSTIRNIPALARKTIIFRATNAKRQTSIKTNNSAILPSFFLYYGKSFMRLLFASNLTRNPGHRQTFP